MYVGGRRLAILGNTIQDIATSHVLRVWQGRKCVISNNKLHNPGGGRHALKLHGPAYNDGRPETRYVEVSDNDILGRVWSVAIGPQDNGQDERLSHIVFERNLLRPEQSIQVDLEIWARNVTIRNNIFNATGSYQYYEAISVGQRGIEPASANVQILNNTVYRGNSASELTAVSISSVASNVRVQNNLVYAPSVSTKSVVSGSCSGLVNDHNLMMTSLGMVSPSTGDFRLTSGSPAIDAGTPLNWVRTDYVGTARPKGSQYDIGAYEY
jgi:hypothetical protein